MQVAIIGGGIGGLTTAIALKQAGIKVQVFEAAPKIKPVGAGIVLATNALQVMEKIGIQEAIIAAGNRMDTMTITLSDFEPLSVIRLEKFVQEFGVQNHAIHRADLHEILVAKLGVDQLRLNKRLSTIGPYGDGYVLNFEDGTELEADFVIGADGIRSVVRSQLFGKVKMRDAGQVCWRGLVPFDLPEKHWQDALEAWSNGKRFGFARLGKDIVYWYLVVDKKLDLAGSDILDHAAGFHPLAEQLIRATDHSKIYKDALMDLAPLQTWNLGRVCLIGDAAHATTPNLGQGACQAIEDAYVLGELARKYTLEEAFDLYPKIRRAKAHTIVRRSWTLGKVAHLSNGFAVGMRNFLFRYLTPDSVMIRQMKELFTLDEV